ncbi:MAG: TIGR04149 family rSAM-modified RiPP [Bacteroidales bacterium]|nr:TIGR04149 family rSAM-modified RiPP [Bacteroidales bacterium]
MLKLKLNRLSDNVIAEKQMNNVMGGAADSCGCCCGCLGTSSNADNKQANLAGDKWTKGCVVMETVIIRPD